MVVCAIKSLINIYFTERIWRCQSHIVFYSIPHTDAVQFVLLERSHINLRGSSQIDKTVSQTPDV